MNADELFQSWCDLWRPPKRMSVSEWAERHFVLSPEYSARTGELRLYGWQREILDSFADPSVNKIVLKIGTQMIKTLAFQVWIAYLISEAPGPALLVQPKEADAKMFSAERLTPMLRDIPALAGRVADNDSGSTLFFKVFQGGNLSLVGARVPGNLARRTIQYAFGDEINKYDASVGKEGSPLRLIEERTTKFGTRKKIVYACSPTVETAPISREYDASDQREPEAPCWSCGKGQVLRWGQVRWDSSLPREQQPASARYICEHCGIGWTDAQRREAAEQTVWVARKPFEGTAGFGSLGHLYSPDKTLEGMTREFLRITAGGSTNDLQVFINTNLAEDWKGSTDTPEWRRIYDRRESYETGVVPAGVLFLTAAVDVQADRLEVEVKGWSRHRENWSVAYEIIQPIRTSGGRTYQTGTSEPEPWDVLADLLRTEWPCEGGGFMQIWCMAIDTGYLPQKVYDFCHRFPRAAHGPAGTRIHSLMTTVPIKGGHSSHKLIESVSDADAARKRAGLKVVVIGTHAIKQEIYDSLRIERSRGDRGPGFCHHPERYDESYFRGLCAETRLVKASGEIEWRRDGRNEPLDLSGYNRAASELCGISRFTESDWSELERRREDLAQRASLPALPKAPAVHPEVAESSRWVPERRWFS